MCLGEGAGIFWGGWFCLVCRVFFGFLGLLCFAVGFISSLADGCKYVTGHILVLGVFLGCFWGGGLLRLR
jgi:hypothetical protein